MKQFLEFDQGFSLLVKCRHVFT